jgi:hypothetical protein
MSVKNYTINNIFLQNFHYFGNGKFKFLNKVEVQVLGLGLWCPRCGQKFTLPQEKEDIVIKVCLEKDHQQPLLAK